MLKRPKIKKGDTVVVVAGENRGKQGTVLRMIPSKDRVVVEGVNVITKHVRPSAANPQGGLEKMEAPIHISNVMLIDSKGTATRVGRRRDINGKLTRYAKTTGEEVKQ